MKSLQTIIKDNCGKHSSLILRAMDDTSNSTWEQFMTVDGLKDVREYINSNSKSGSTYTAVLAAAIAPYESEFGGYVNGWRKLLKIERVPSQQTYMSIDDLEKWAGYQAMSDMELCIQISGLIEARTGARISDTKGLDELNVENGMLTYLSEKTARWASIPASDILMRLLKLRSRLNLECTDVYYNRVVSTICKRVGIDNVIKLNQCGKYHVGPKYEFITSHDFRHGFCTNLHLAGEELLTISRMAGHSNTIMTERYICATRRPGSPSYDYFERLDNIIETKFFNRPQ